MQRSTVPTWAFILGIVVLLCLVLGAYFMLRSPRVPTPDTLPNASDLPGAR